jgi:hypothetical protein
VTTTVTASDGTPTAVVVTASQQPQASGIETMSPNQPSQHSTAPAAIPTGTSLEAVIGGIGYSLPSLDEDAFEVLMFDGSIAQLLADKIIIWGQTVIIPSGLSSETTLPGGITAKPAEATTPEGNDDDNGGGGGGSLFGALGGIAKGATSALGGAIDGVGAVTAGALGFAAGTTGAISSLSDPLSGAIGNVGNFVSSLNGIQKSFPGNELTKGAFDTFTGAHQLARQALNWMKSTQNVAQGFANLPADVQSKLKSTAGDFAKSGGTLDQCKAAMEAFKDFPWEDADVPSQTAQPSATENPTDKASTQSTKATATAQSTSMQSTTDKASTTQSASSTVTSSQSSSSSSETPTSTPTLSNYAIISKPGTSYDTFKQFVSDLDGGGGELAKWDLIKQQMYIAKLNVSQVAEIPQQHTFIQAIITNTFDEDADGSSEAFRAVDTSTHVHLEPHEPPAFARSDIWAPTSLELKSHLAPRTLLAPDSQAPWWKKIISAPPRDISGPNSDPRFDPPYLADDTLGRGVTVYVLDDGFDTDNEVRISLWSLCTYINPSRISKLVHVVFTQSLLQMRSQRC